MQRRRERPNFGEKKRAVQRIMPPIPERYSHLERKMLVRVMRAMHESGRSVSTSIDRTNVDWMVSLLFRAAGCRRKIRCEIEVNSNRALLEELLRLIDLCGRRLDLSDRARAGLADYATAAPSVKKLGG